MSKRFLLLTATAVTAFGLTACGTNAAPTTPSFPNAPAPASVTTAASPAAAAPASQSPSYLTKKVGDRAGITNTDTTTAVDFWITKITVDPKCDPYSKREPGKHTVLLDVTVKTAVDKDVAMGGGAFDLLPGLINPYAFSTTGSSGVTDQAETDLCLTSTKELPSTYAPNHTYTGQIAFATPDASGKLQLTTPSGFFHDGVLGWEWSY
ncbi:hypothetical protein [Amycolatopsis sp. NPDC051903]|uniref:hypothetical protein n=1 Tax=Amycolatopsis sp. NPDC051903 TaxID=3363936 RepID=UPI0037A44908